MRRDLPAEQTRPPRPRVAILAGGRGVRLSEYTDSRPKPMIPVGGRPILWHIMMHYARYGFDEFVVALGYLGDHVREHLRPPDGCAVELVETGLETATGGRIRRLASHLGNSTFMLTWGDAVADVDLVRLLAFHRGHGRLATVTAVHPPARYGRLDLEGDRVRAFSEKPEEDGAWINGAYFVLEPGVFDYVPDDGTAWELEPMERLARDGELMAFRHGGFWQCMDTVHDKRVLEDLWDSGAPPWKVWR